MYKKTTLIVLIAFFSIPQVFSQDEELEQEKNKIEFDILISPSLSIVQDKFSPSIVGKIGIGNNNLRIYLMAENNYFFSTRSDNSRGRTIETYYGLEWVTSGLKTEKVKWMKSKKNKYWGGAGVSYCPNPLSELHDKKPIKFYGIIDFGGVTVRPAYVWSEFFYPSISVSFGF
jgi:hypothetical protein